MFITFEGADGTGKSTQIRRLADHLTAQGHRVRLTREPGGTVGAENIRSLLVEGDVDRWTARTELLLFTAARLDHMERCILPALEAGELVLCDRFFDSTCAYQAVTPELREAAEDLHRKFIGRQPDLTLLLDMPAEVSIARALDRMGKAPAREDRFERQGVRRLEEIRARFLEIARHEPGRVTIIDAARSPDLIAAEIRERVGARLTSQRGSPAP